MKYDSQDVGLTSFNWELIKEECGRSIKEFFMKIPANKEVEDVLSNGDTNEMGLRILQLLMAHLEKTLQGWSVLQM
ncbi:hypothetical protein KUCAC02_009378 [Chaenocephalus aceratus]|uniref:Uncharacterized protein n=1 Tax=Chaenocephalus aceratus TaxID=36190 RepID=A0ACB9WTC5_CHAAC|nr:hypothetical protein KUCAC02_009378 [Chaenocephalus aceratus]